MKILSISVCNFASYDKLDLQLSDRGLVLISGPTGAGKSTIMDAVTWVLYGKTGKDGNADEIRNWKNGGDPVKGVLEVDVSGGVRLTVVRIRGGQSRNDLYWTEGGLDTLVRGKDLTETQKLLNERLGVDFDQYTTGAYFHEFNPTSSFFVANAKARRAIFEKVADLSLPLKIAQRSSESKKEVGTAVATLFVKLDKVDSEINLRQKLERENQEKRQDWETKRATYAQNLRNRSETFEDDKKTRTDNAKTRYKAWEAQMLVKMNEASDKLNQAELALANPASSTCDSCGQTVQAGPESKAHFEKEYQKIRKSLADMADTENPYASAIDESRALTNQYQVLIEAELAKPNPFVSAKSNNDIQELNEEKVTLESDLKDYTRKFNALDRINDLSHSLRASLLIKAVDEIQSATNEYLNKYFDSEIKVEFELEDADSLKVSIQKSGYDCVYKQLSKGQRGLLRLCFSVAMMKVSSNSIGTHFDTLMFDEALDGLDTSMKLKAFRLFEQLSSEHGTLLVIDHCEELKELFSSRYEVSMDSDVSEIKYLG